MSIFIGMGVCVQYVCGVCFDSQIANVLNQVYLALITYCIYLVFS